MMVGSVLCSALYCIAFMDSVFAAIAKPACEDGTALLQIVFSEKATAEHANARDDIMAVVENGQSGVYYPKGGRNYDPEPGAYPSPPYPGTVGGDKTEVAYAPAYSASGAANAAEYDVGYAGGGNKDYEGVSGKPEDVQSDEYDDDDSEKADNYDDDYTEGKSADLERLQQPVVYEENMYTNDIGHYGGGQYADNHHDKYGKYHDFSHATTKDRRDKYHQKGRCGHHDHSGKCGGYHSINKYEDYHDGTMRKDAYPKSQDSQHAEYHRTGGTYGGNRKAYYDKERRSQYHEYHKEGKRDYEQYGKPLDHVYAKHGDHHHGNSQEEKHVRNVYNSRGGTFHNPPYLKKMGDKYGDYHGAGKYLDASNKHDAYRGDHSSEYKRSGNALIQSGTAKPWHHMTVKEVHRCTKLIKVYKKEIVNKCSEIKTNFTVARWTWGKIKHLPAMKTKSTCMKVPVWKKTDKCTKFVKTKKACKKVPRVKLSHTCMKHFQVYKKEVEPTCHEKNKHVIVARHIFGKLKPVHVQKIEKVCVYVPVLKKVHKCMKWSKKAKTEFVEQCVEKGMGWRHY